MEAARVKQKRKQNQMVAIMRRLFTAFLAAACFGQAKATESMCSSLNSLEDRPYWTEVATCTPCASLSGCGYCLSTLACVEGDDSGPSDGSPCPEWISKSDACPNTPACEVHDACDACAGDSDCAWCASEGTCMTISSIFEHDCRGTVFDVPCPESFVTTNRVMGNVVVEADPLFGGGEFTAAGFKIGALGTTLESPADVTMEAGDRAGKNESGGSAVLRAANGLSANRGRGGDVRIAAGRSAGNSTTGGSTTIRAGNAKSGVGGSVSLSGGDSNKGFGGDAVLTSGSSTRGLASGDISVLTSDGNQHPSGDVRISTGTSAASASGEVLIATANAARAGQLRVRVGMSSLGVGGALDLAGGVAEGLFTGGSVSISTGASVLTSSGNFLITSANAGSIGVSGDLDLRTGTATLGSSGEIALSTGAGGGNIDVLVGDASSGNGGRVALIAGLTSSFASRGGKVSVTAGAGSEKGGRLRSKVAKERSEEISSFAEGARRRELEVIYKWHRVPPPTGLAERSRSVLQTRSQPQEKFTLQPEKATVG